MNNLVKFLTTEDNERIENPTWCLVVMEQGYSAFCGAGFFTKSESPVEYKLKQVKRGGITCPECLRKIRFIKSIKL